MEFVDYQDFQKGEKKYTKFKIFIICYSKKKIRSFCAVMSFMFSGVLTATLRGEMN